MKKFSIALAVLLVASITAHAQSTTTANVMGYTKKDTCGDAKYNAYGVPFLGTNITTVPELFTDTLPINSEIGIYNAGSGYSFERYEVTSSGPPSFNLSTNWAPGTTEISGTTAFWLKLPAGSADKTTLFSGDVVNETNTITIRPGFNFVAYPYSSDVTWTNTTVATSASVNDAVYLWDSANQGYTTITRYEVTSSGPPFFNLSTNWSQLDVTIEMGDGFWYSSRSAITNIIIETQPYTL